MNRVVQLITLFAASAPASAYEFRARFVERVASVDTVISDDWLDNTSGTRRRIRLQIGVFDSPASAAPLGGIVGWNLGSIVVSFDSYHRGDPNSRPPRPVHFCNRPARQRESTPSRRRPV